VNPRALQAGLELRDTLQEACEEQLQRQHAKDEHNWLDFWKQAEELEQRAAASRKVTVRAPPTSMFARTSSTSSEVPVVSSTQASQQDFSNPCPRLRPGPSTSPRALVGGAAFLPNQVHTEFPELAARPCIFDYISTGHCNLIRTQRTLYLCIQYRLQLD